MKHATLFLLSLAGPSFAQDAYVLDTSVVPMGPGINSSTENVDWGDIDLDGDWDIAVADGGDDGNDQDRLWVNQGGAQAGLIGVFLDETAAQAPSVNDTSRDCEFADIDGDGDVDLGMGNTAQISNQSSRIWVNQGLLQGGSVGFYTDETSTRWVGLAGPGSSIPPQLVLPGGGFIDWNDDIEFGDLDNDGDLDVVLASAGGAYGGQAPTHIFLNDGLGFFSEFNPSGFQLSGVSLSPGDPAIWCDGVDQEGTSDATGTFADIDAASRDVDIGDLDGDLDLDLVLDDENSIARAFANRLDGSSLAPVNPSGLGFRDVTGSVFQAGSQMGGASFEHELGDLDGDGDLDLYGVDWFFSGFALNDVLLENAGDGTFGPPVIVPGSTNDGDEADFVDYDGDGDLDIFLAQFSGEDKLYRNDNAFFGDIVEVPIEGTTSIAVDADFADADGDGDLDAIVGADNNAVNSLLRNVVDVPDQTAPVLPRLDALADWVAAPGVAAVRAQVYDNRPYYQTWYVDTELLVEVDDVALPPISARSSAGQIFRAELPTNLVGAIDYRFEATDERGNTGSSATEGLVGSTALAFQSSFGASTAGTAAGTAPTLTALSVPFHGSTLYLAGHSDAPPSSTVFFVGSVAKQDPPLLVPGIVLTNIALPPLIVEAGLTDADGDAVLSIPIPPGTPGTSFFFQLAVLDPTPSGEILSASTGLEVVTQ
ncbi:MAG: VCBS repeat-containing protein [Planctomycetota bacterium]